MYLWLVCVNSIVLDDDQSDAESTDSATDVFADIPLPTGTELIPQLTTSSLSPTLDAIPLPQSPVYKKPVADNHKAVSLSENVISKVDTLTSSECTDAVHAKTSVGTITLLLNRKLGPRLNRASVFDVPDDNTKEVNRKLLKLRRLKRMKKSDGQSEMEGGSATGRKALQERILEWKEELLNDRNFKSKLRSSKDVSITTTSTAISGDSKDRQSNAAGEDSKTEAEDVSVPLSKAVAVKSEAVDSKLVPSLKSTDDLYVAELYDSFMKVMSSNDQAQLDWPREMIQGTRLSPKLVYSCNPLYFSFRKLQLMKQQNGQNNPESKKHKHQKKRKKTRVGNTEDHTAGKNADSFDLKTELRKSSKSDCANMLPVTKGHTKEAKNSLEHSVRIRKTKPATHTDEAIKSNKSLHSALSHKHKHSVGKHTSLKHVGGSHSSNIQQPTVGEVDRIRPCGTKDTAKSRWDTSSDSEVETARPSADDWKTSKNTRNSVPALRDQHCAVEIRSEFNPDNRSRSRSPHWSSDSSRRSRKRSRHRSLSSSVASSYSHSGSSYCSSPYPYRRRRSTYNSSRSSSSFINSDYSHSSRSYSRSRSVSRRRHYHSRSYSRSQSSSVSRSPHRRLSSKHRQQHRAGYDWRAQTTLKRAHTEPSTAHQTKQPPKASTNKSKTDTAVEAKNSSDEHKPIVAAAEPTNVGHTSAEIKESQLPVITADLRTAEVVKDAAVEDVKSIPTPEEHMQSIPLPVPENPSTGSSKKSFIGPVLPSNHPLAHKQEIPLPPTAKFQWIGPNDPLVFRSMPPPPPPPAVLTSPSKVGTVLLPPPRPPSPPTEDMEDDIAGDEDPIPQMLDLKTFKPADFIPPEQDEQYGALRRQAERHARRQRLREETGMDIDEDSEDDSTEVPLDDQLAEQAYLDEAAMFQATPVLQIPQQHLVGQPLSTMMASGTNLVPVHMLPSAGGGVVGLEPSLMSVVQPGQTRTVLAVSPAAAALARAQEEAEAEAQIRQQVAAAQAIAAARQRAAELVQLIPGHIGVGAASSPALAALRPALSLHALPLQALASQQPQQQLIQLPAGRVVGLPSIVPGGVQVLAQPQAQPAPLVIGPNGTILRLIRR